MSLNKVMLIGRLGKDPECRSLQNGSSAGNFSLATSERWKDKDGLAQEKTEWHNVVVYGKLAEHCKQYLAKGREVFVEGKIQTRKWQDKEGKDRYTTEVIAFGVQFIGNKPVDGATGPATGSATGAATGAASSTPAPGASDPTDAIPF